MWWCCGRKNKEAPGCKFGKHVNKDDDDNEIGATGDKRKRIINESTRCFVRWVS